MVYILTIHYTYNKHIFFARKEMMRNPLLIFAPIAVILFYKFGLFFLGAAVLFYIIFYAYPYVRRLMRGKDVNYIDPGVVQKNIEAQKDMLMIDIRSSVDYCGMFGHIDGAINMPFGELMVRINETADRLAGFKETPIIIIGSQDETEVFKAYTVLKQKGFSDVGILNYGIAGWLKASLPVVDRNANNKK